MSKENKQVEEEFVVETLKPIQKMGLYHVDPDAPIIDLSKIEAQLNNKVDLTTAQTITGNKTIQANWSFPTPTLINNPTTKKYVDDKFAKLKWKYIKIVTLDNVASLYFFEDTGEINNLDNTEIGVEIEGRFYSFPFPKWGLIYPIQDSGLGYNLQFSTVMNDSTGIGRVQIQVTGGTLNQTLVGLYIKQ